MQAVEGAAADLAARRSRDYVGQMLWHHTARSTEYFRRWVELKEAAAAMAAEKSGGDNKETATVAATAATAEV